LGCGLELKLDYPTGRTRLCQPLPAAPRPTQGRERLHSVWLVSSCAVLSARRACAFAKSESFRAASDGDGPFLERDAQKVRLATACEQAGLPMAGIAAAIRAGRLSFGFLEAPPLRRWAVRSALAYRQVSQDTGLPLELLGSFLESIGFARTAPDELIREDELEVVPLLQLGVSTAR
jgi:hypothetical protein